MTSRAPKRKPKSHQLARAECVEVGNDDEDEKTCNEEKEKKKTTMFMYSRKVLVRLNKNEIVTFLILTAIALSSYLASVWFKCPQQQLDPCRKWLIDDHGIVKLLLVGSFGLLLYNYLFYQIFFARKYPMVFSGVIWSITVIIAWHSAGGYDFMNHGGYNRLVLVGSLLCTASCLLWWKSLDLIVHYFQYLPIFNRTTAFYKYSLILLCALSCFFVFLSRNHHANKMYWENPSIEVSDYHLNQSECVFEKPSYHWWGVFSGALNFAQLTSCTGYDTSWLDIDKETTKDSYYIYPTVNDITIQNMTDYKAFANFALNRVRLIYSSDIDKYESVLKIPSSNFSEKPKLTVKVVPDPILIEKSNRIRQEKFPINSNQNRRPMNNVLVLLIDALSRQSFVRNLPKTLDYLKKLSYRASLDVHTYMKFHSIRPFTGPNCEPLRYGVSFETFQSRPIGTCQKSLFHTAVENGYVTGYGGSLCNYNELELEDVVRTCLPPHNHKLAFCDPNVFDPDNPFSFLKGGFSMMKRCLYGKPVHQYIMDYTLSFWEQYPDTPKFFMGYISDAHEWTGELVQYMDNPLMEFLTRMEKYLENTTVILLSDHGNHLNGIYRLLKPDGPEIEMKTPLLNIIHKRRKKTAENYFKLVTMFDVHKTIVQELTNAYDEGFQSDQSDPNSHRDGHQSKTAEWTDAEEGVKSYNLLYEIVPSNRTCEQAGIVYKPHCICPT